MDESDDSKRGKLKIFLGFLFFIFVLFTLVLYWFVPFSINEFKIKSSENGNFSLGLPSLEGMQFYPNMRYPDSKISYKIENCPLQKKESMEQAFEIISNLTILEFYSKSSEEEIFVTCENKNKIEERFFIAGEGGPVNVTSTKNFNVILSGKILLIKETMCPKPNVGMHELLHSLGFDHSQNPENIMYNISSCRQSIGDDIINLINSLYSTPSLPDLDFENVSAVMNGKYLDANISIRNNGLKGSENFSLDIYADEKFIEEINFDYMEIGYGSMVSLSNLWIPKINVENLKFVINYDFNELDKNNNKIILELKK